LDGKPSKNGSTKPKIGPVKKSEFRANIVLTIMGWRLKIVAVDGINITEAEMEKEDGQTVYVFEGDANGKEYEIEVTPEGKVNEVEEKGKDNGGDDDGS
jgi:hypothetical protein